MAASHQKHAKVITSPGVRTDAARPLLTLCLATYKRARYLDRYLTHHLTAFDSAGLDYELLVSDDCSPDETPEILARYAERHPRMRVIRQPKNVGSFANMLITQREARGELIVSIADDDMMVPHQLLAYIKRMEADRELVMVQAPWFLLDENRNDEIIGKFYDFDGERRFNEGDYLGVLQFVLRHHVFPECWLIRRSIIPAVIGPAPRFSYHFFNVLTRAIGLGPVLFSPDPHIVATAVNKAGTAQEGTAEVMEGWDRYRGGLEYLASHARQFQPGSQIDPSLLSQSMQNFTLQRMTVAARINASCRKWADAYHIQRRVHAYGCHAPVHVSEQDLSRLAAIETAIFECCHLGARRIVMSDRVASELLALVDIPSGVELVRAADVAFDGAPTAWCHLGDPATIPAAPEVFGFDLMPGIHRFLPLS